MLDWREIVRDKLTPLRVGEKRQEDIVAELAGHLDELYEDLVRQGRSEVEAVRFASSSVADWDELRREIQLAANEGGIMNHRLGPAGKRRLKTLWLPGACTIALSGILLRLLQTPSAPLPHVFWPQHDMPFVIYWQWFVCLPLVGGIGAYWSLHAGGKLLDRALAASFPALALMCFPGLILPFGLVFQWIVHHNSPFVPTALFLLGWVVFPEAALLLGAIPFLRGDAAESGQVAASQ
ncbi:MAG: permease prefix domain 1-containing protein [Terriglobia bacterium]